MGDVPLCITPWLQLRLLLTRCLALYVANCWEALIIVGRAKRVLNYADVVIHAGTAEQVMRCCIQGCGQIRLQSQLQ